MGVEKGRVLQARIDAVIIADDETQTLAMLRLEVVAEEKPRLNMVGEVVLGDSVLGEPQRQVRLGAAGPAGLRAQGKILPELIELPRLGARIAVYDIGEIA